MDITIYISSLYSRVAEAAEYAAVHLENPEAYTSMLIPDEARELLDSYHEDALAALTTMFRSHNINAKISRDGNSIVVSLSLSRAFPDEMEGTLKTHIVDYLFHYILSRWYQIANRPDAEVETIQAQQALAMAHRVAHTRTRPVPPP